jgi:hypothetical protein
MPIDSAIVHGTNTSSTHTFLTKIPTICCDLANDQVPHYHDSAKLIAALEQKLAIIAEQTIDK